MEKPTNVIQFPNSRNYVPEVPTNANILKYNHIEESLATIIPMLFNNVELAGFRIIPEFGEDSEYIKDCSLAIESIRSMMCKYYDMKHPLQTVAENVFESEGEGILRIVKTLNIELEPEEEFPEENES
jgi:hypothetical protein